MTRKNRVIYIVRVMQKFELELMPMDELWALHEVISETLAARLAAQKRLLEKRLNLLSHQAARSLTNAALIRRCCRSSAIPITLLKHGLVAAVGRIRLLSNLDWGNGWKNSKFNDLMEIIGPCINCWPSLGEPAWSARSQCLASRYIEPRKQRNRGTDRSVHP